MLHLSGGSLIFENTNSMKIPKGNGDSFHFGKEGRKRWKQSIGSTSQEKILILPSLTSLPTVQSELPAVPSRLQITVFWVSCRPSCWPNGQDVGRHDGRHEKPENAYTSWIFLFDRVMLANLTIEKNDFPRASSLYGHVNTFSASLSKKNFISVGRQTKLRKHVSCVG